MSRLYNILMTLSDEMIRGTKDNLKRLGCSREQARNRFHQNQTALTRKGQWEAFDCAVREYSQMGHAEQVPESDLLKPEADVYYLPMHWVVKTSSTSTKLRIFFDASAKTTTGVSLLNDTLLQGPTLSPTFLCGGVVLAVLNLRTKNLNQ